MQEEKLYRPSNSSLLESTPAREKQRSTFVKRFIITLLWSFPIFTAVSVYNAPASQWLALSLGSLLIAVLSGVIAMCIPTRYKLVFVPVGVLAGFGIALLSASH